MAPKWQIKKLNKKQKLLKASEIVLKNRFNKFLKALRLYLKDNSVENLHSVRISIRRLRYNMELFISCYDRKLFLSFYNNICSLQDSTGAVRDLDILIENISSLNQMHPLNDLTQLEKEIQFKRQNLKNELELKLTDLLQSDFTKDFNELIS